MSANLTEFKVIGKPSIIGLAALADSLLSAGTRGESNTIQDIINLWNQNGKKLSQDIAKAWLALDGVTEYESYKDVHKSLLGDEETVKNYLVQQGILLENTKNLFQVKVDRTAYEGKIELLDTQQNIVLTIPYPARPSKEVLSEESLKKWATDTDENHVKPIDLATQQEPAANYAYIPATST